MVRIGICDNNKLHIKQLSNILKCISLDKNIQLEISTFNSSNELIEFCNRYKDYFDLIFLDVLLSGLNGIDTVKYIRSFCPDIYIVFVTSTKDYALDSYSVNASGYILKPCSYTSISNIFLNIYRKIIFDKKNTIYVKSNHDIHTFKLGEIIYFESNLRKITAYLNDGQVISFYSKLSDLENMINTNTFIRCHRSFLVNLSYIKNIVSSNLVTTSDMCLPISKKYSSSTKDTFTEYIKARISC